MTGKEKDLRKLDIEELIEKANILIEALPYIKKFYGSTFVIKYGGAAMIDEELKKNILQDVILLKFVGINPVIVHGGGKEISDLMKRLGKEPVFIDGHRVTDKETLKIAEMVLVGSLNKEIVALINHLGGKAVGLSGKDGNLIKAKKRLMKDKSGKSTKDVGFVGDVVKINAEIINVLDENDFIPVISPLGIDDEGQTYNINADSVASAIAAELKADKLILLTDVKGVLKNEKDPDSIIAQISEKEIKQLIKEDVIKGGMIPKVEACLQAIDGGVKRAHILDGRIPHTILLEIFTDKGIGTLIRSE